MDAVLLALIESMEVKVNIMEEERKAKALYEQGVKAMRLAKGLDANDYADSPQNRVQEIVIAGLQSDEKQIECGHSVPQSYPILYCPPCLEDMRLAAVK